VLGSLAFALTVVFLLALACIAGTVIPQGSQVENYLARPGGHPVLDVLISLGLTNVFYSWWFAGLLFALAASLCVCTRLRYQAMRRATGLARLRIVGSLITHLSLLLVLAGGVVRVFWGQKGMIQFREGQVVADAEGPEGRLALPFSIRLTKFELEFHQPRDSKVGAVDRLQVQWAEQNLVTHFPIDLNVDHPVAPPGAQRGERAAYTVKVLRYVSDFSIDGASGEVKSRSEAPNNPALHVQVAGGGVTNTQWVFSRFPDFGSHSGNGAGSPLKFRFLAAAPVERGMSGAIKAFKSTVEIIEHGAVVDTRTISVNSPLSRDGFTFYQTSYNPDDLTWSALQVVRDPGVPIVYAGFILMMAGLTLVFCVTPWLVDQRRMTGGIT
jgi:cytochrome c biogenesis protein ResB